MNSVRVLYGVAWLWKKRGAFEGSMISPLPNPFLLPRRAGGWAASSQSHCCSPAGSMWGEWSPAEHRNNTEQYFYCVESLYWLILCNWGVWCVNWWKLDAWEGISKSGLNDSGICVLVTWRSSVIGACVDEHRSTGWIRWMKPEESCSEAFGAVTEELRSGPGECYSGLCSPPLLHTVCSPSH